MAEENSARSFQLRNLPANFPHFEVPLEPIGLSPSVSISFNCTGALSFGNWRWLAERLLYRIPNQGCSMKFFYVDIVLCCVVLVDCIRQVNCIPVQRLTSRPE
ncbi:hypothetical protein U1Q18_050497 [Sarracenia purpurea var. burkii]